LEFGAPATCNQCRRDACADNGITRFICCDHRSASFNLWGNLQPIRGTKHDKTQEQPASSQHHAERCAARGWGGCPQMVIIIVNEFNVEMNPKKQRHLHLDAPTP